MAKKRIGIVVGEWGLPSEVWVERQCLEFKRIEPVLMFWQLHGDRSECLNKFESYRFSQPFSPPKSIVRRVANRLGSASAQWPDRASRLDVERTIGDANVDGVLCHFAWTGLKVSAAMAGKLPIVWHVHGRDVSARLQETSYRAAVARALPTVDHVVAVSAFQIERLRSLGLTSESSVIPCGAPYRLFSASPPALREPGQRIRFISVGRISPEKGPLENLEAFERLNRDDAELVVVGDGPMMGVLRDAVARSPARQRIRLAGSLPSERIAQELACAHVFLQHSKTAGGAVEGFGVSIAEAGAAGLPIIASRLGGIPDQVNHGENGFLFAPRDISRQAESMMVLADDEARRREMGACARILAKRFDSVVMTQRLEEVLLKLTGGRADY